MDAGPTSQRMLPSSAPSMKPTITTRVQDARSRHHAVQHAPLRGAVGQPAHHALQRRAHQHEHLDRHGAGVLREPAIDQRDHQRGDVAGRRRRADPGARAAGRHRPGAAPRPARRPGTRRAPPRRPPAAAARPCRQGRVPRRQHQRVPHRGERKAHRAAGDAGQDPAAAMARRGGPFGHASVSAAATGAAFGWLAARASRAWRDASEGSITRPLPAARHPASRAHPSGPGRRAAAARWWCRSR